MPTPAERLETAVASAEADVTLLHDITNGASTDPDVVTEGGNVKPVAKVVKEAEDALDAALVALAAGLGLYNRVAMPPTSATAGAVGDFAVSGDELAIYVATVGWRFLTFYSK